MISQLLTRAEGRLGPRDLLLAIGVNYAAAGAVALAGATGGGRFVLVAVARDGTLALPLTLLLVAVLLVLRRTERPWAPGDLAPVLVGTGAAFALSALVLPQDGPSALAAGAAAVFGAALGLAAGCTLVALTRLLHRNALPFALGALAVALVATPGLAGAAPTAVAAADPVAACTSGSGPATRSYDVSAIDVDVTLNNYGDHDPKGRMYVLTSQIPAVRAAERARTVTPGLHEDPIQPLVVRANGGDCVQITFTNASNAGALGMHIDGLSYAISSSGDAIGNNPRSDVSRGQSRTYRFHVPDDPTSEGVHYIRPGPGNRALVDHGLFGALVVEPAGSRWFSAIRQGGALESGWEAIVVPGGAGPACVPSARNCSFREFVLLHHEIGHDNEVILDRRGRELPQVDDTTGSYRPSAFALNYRSESFRNRLLDHPTEKAHAYSSYVFGDPATPMPRSYLGEPTKVRIAHSGGEKFHVYHLHGGGDRWRANPVADPSNNYAETGLNKAPKPETESLRLDSQSIGPGESYDLEIEGGAGGVQQSVGDFLFHCHIAKHYNSGMWGMWRVLNTRQADVVALPDRPVPPEPVDSAGLIGRTMPDGTVLTASTVDDWIRPQLPPAGVRRGKQDAAVWNWTRRGALYLGEPADPTVAVNSPRGLQGEPNLLPGDRVVDGRPVLLFDPVSGRPAYPMLRPHIGQRPPFAGAGHSGAPYLGDVADAPAGGPVDPYAARADGLCPRGAPNRHFNVVAVDTEVPRTPTVTDPEGKLFTLAEDKEALLAGERPAEPLAIRANQGDCVGVTFTNEIPDDAAFDHFSKASMHIHHVQFDIQASDGVTTGYAYEHSVRPYPKEDPTLRTAVPAGTTTVTLSDVRKFVHADATGAPSKPWIAIGEGTDGIEVRQIGSIDERARTVTFTAPLAREHLEGEYAGTEYINYAWYPDVVLDNVFWHDHVDGIHGWGHGLVGQLVVEPRGSTYHDPVTGAEVDSGALVDIHTPNPLARGLVDGSFRELVLWTINDNDRADYSTLNLRADPLSADPLGPRGEQANRFSSYRYGDPVTPLPRLYPDDPLVIRAVSVSPTVDSLRVQGGRTTIETRYLGPDGHPASSVIDTVHAGVSEKQTVVVNGAPPWMRMRPGDYLYGAATDLRQRQGAWGIVRVLPGRVPDLQPLPQIAAPPDPYVLPAVTGAAPPAAAGPGDPCPPGAPARSFAVTAAGIPSDNLVRKAFVPDDQLAAVQRKRIKADPLVLHAVAGECVTVHVTNRLAQRVSFTVGELDREVGSGGVNVGFAPDQTIAPGGRRDYVFFVPTPKLRSMTIADTATLNGAKEGLYGAVAIAQASPVPGVATTFTDPVTGAARDVGPQVVVHVPGAAVPHYRDATLLLADDDPRMSQDFMPYPTNAKEGKSMINYRIARPGDGPDAFRRPGQAAILTAYAGDPLMVHGIVAPGSEQAHVLSLGGLHWNTDNWLEHSDGVEALAIAPGESTDAFVTGGAGVAGDHFVGDLRRPFTQAGMWGLLRVLPPPGGSGCPLTRVDGSRC